MWNVWWVLPEWVQLHVYNFTKHPTLLKNLLTVGNWRRKNLHTYRLVETPVVHKLIINFLIFAEACVTLVFLHSRLKLYCKYLPFFFPFDVFRNSVQITRHIVKNHAPKHCILTYANMLLRHQYGGRLICICCDVTWKPIIDRPGKY